MNKKTILKSIRMACLYYLRKCLIYCNVIYFHSGSNSSVTITIIFENEITVSCYSCWNCPNTTTICGSTATQYAIRKQLNHRVRFRSSRNCRSRIIQTRSITRTSNRRRRGHLGINSDTNWRRLSTGVTRCVARNCGQGV